MQEYVKHVLAQPQYVQQTVLQMDTSLLEPLAPLVEQELKHVPVQQSPLLVMQLDITDQTIPSVPLVLPELPLVLPPDHKPVPLDTSKPLPLQEQLPVPHAESEPLSAQVPPLQPLVMPDIT